MANFAPGRVAGRFRSRQGEEVVIRYPKWDDLDLLTDWINELSQEDTFISYSGERFTLEQEADFLAGLFKDMEFQNKVFLCAFVGDDLASTCVVHRRAAHRRQQHVGMIGLSTRAAFRGQGIGRELSRTAIEEAAKNIPGLRLIMLEVFGNNKAAIDLYRKLGFRETGRIPGGVLFRGELVDDVIMCLDLGGAGS